MVNTLIGAVNTFNAMKEKETLNKHNEHRQGDQWSDTGGEGPPPESIGLSLPQEHSCETTAPLTPSGRAIPKMFMILSQKEKN